MPNPNVISLICGPIVASAVVVATIAGVSIMRNKNPDTTKEDLPKQVDIKNAKENEPHAKFNLPQRSNFSHKSNPDAKSLKSNFSRESNSDENKILSKHKAFNNTSYENNKYFGVNVFSQMEMGTLNVDESVQTYSLMKDKGNSTIKSIESEPIFTHIPSVEDIHQYAGEKTCYLLSSLASIVRNNPMKIYDMIKDFGSYVIVRFYDIDLEKNGTKNFTARYIKVFKNKYFGEMNRSKGWVNLIAEAYLIGGFNNKNHGLYLKTCSEANKKIAQKKPKFMGRTKRVTPENPPNSDDNKYGFDNFTLMNLLGKDVETIDVDEMGISRPSNITENDWINSPYNEKSLNIFEKIKSCEDNNQPMCVTFKSKSDSGLADAHAYSVCGYKEIEGRKFVIISDPYKGVTVNEGQITQIFQNPIIDGKINPVGHGDVLPAPFYKINPEGKWEKFITAGNEKIMVELNDFMDTATTISIVKESIGSFNMFDNILCDGDNPKNPITLRYFNDYEQKYIDSIHKNMPSEIKEKELKVEEFLRKMINSKKTSFAINVPPEAILGILRDNEIKNRFGIGRYSFGGADVNDKDRIEASTHFFGVPPLPEKFKYCYEKFGYLASSDIKEDLKQRANVIAHNVETAPKDFNSRKAGVGSYGGVIIVLNKEKMKNRTTMTFGDTARNPFNHLGIATKVANPQISCIVPKNGSDFSFFNYLYDAIINGKVKEDVPSDIMIKILDNSPLMKIDYIYKYTLAFSNYIELQFHGKVTTDDIDKIFIDENVVSKDQAEQLAKNIREKGISCEIIEPSHTTASP